MLKVRPVHPELRINIELDRELIPSSVQSKIEKIWENEISKKGDKLFNGEILCFSNIEGPNLNAKITEYKSFVAQLRDPNLFDDLKIKILAVSGIVTFQGRLIFGRRNKEMTQEPGKWELVPSGGMDPHETISGQFFKELKEELNLERTSVKYCRPFLLIEDTVQHTIDIGIDAELMGSRQDVETLIEKGSSEYSEYQWVELGETKNFCESLGPENIVDVSIEILKAKGLWK